MADVLNALNKLNTDEVAQDKPTSEALFNKIAGSINGLIERPFGFDVLTGSGNWVCPDNVFTVLVVGVGGGGGGGEGGDATNNGSNGSPGNNTTFNGSAVALGGVGGERGRSSSFVVGTADAPKRIEGGRGRGGGQNGGIAIGESGSGGSGAPSALALGGTGYGAGGDGGAGGSQGGAGGGAGRIGFRLFSVTPGNSYAYVAGTGGPGGSGSSSGGNGSSGSNGALAVFYMSE